jgi:hypothetical protein
MLAAPGTDAPPPLPAPSPALGPYALPEPKAAFFDELSAILAADPAPKQDAPLLARLAELGIVPGGRPSRGPADVVAALEEGIDRGADMMSSAGGRQTIAGWSGSFSAGVYGTDYRTRARVARDALGASVPEQALYYFCHVDESGEPLTGARRYRVRFPSGRLPPFGPRGFWSLTMYGSDRFLVSNPLERYAVGDRSGHLVHGGDGSLEIHLGTRVPEGRGLEPNWLPAPSGPFVLCLRIYVPTAEVRSRWWWPPAVEVVEAVEAVA